jgi:hypothetical protein
LRVKEVKMKMKDKIFRRFLPPVVVVLVATMLLLCAVPASGRTLGNTTGITGTIVRNIVGETKAVNCTTLDNVTLTLYQGAVNMTSTVSGGTGNYTLAVPALGNYNVTASKAGFRDETQAISITELTTYTLDFAGDHGLIPDAPNLSYVLQCINLWKFGTPPCQLGMSKVLAVVNAWKNPIT